MQSMAWTSTPSPGCLSPTMRSPGTGWQHGARWKAMPGVSPLIDIARACWGQSSGSVSPLALPGTSASMTSRSDSLAEPIAAISSSSLLIARRLAAAAMAFLPTFDGRRPAISSNSLRPIAATSCRSLARTARRIAARALPVTTKPSQDSWGEELRLRMISMTSPVVSVVRSGTCRPLIFAPTAEFPRSVWTA